MELNITKGKCEVKFWLSDPQDEETKNYEVVAVEQKPLGAKPHFVVAECFTGDPAQEQEEANAELINEAFNVANETGYTPGQLAEQKAELLEALNAALSYLNVGSLISARTVLNKELEKRIYAKNVTS